MFDLFFLAVPLLLIGGVVLQVVALRQFEGGWRIAAWVPALGMGAALAVAVLGSLAGSNIAPIWVVIALPPCLVWLFALWTLRSFASWVAG